MRRSDLLKLRERTWFQVEGDTLRCCVVPSADSGTAALAVFGLLSDELVSEFCKRVFVDFDGYFEEDGTTAIPNTHEARVEVYAGWPAARKAINEGIQNATKELAEGEAVAVSD